LLISLHTLPYTTALLSSARSQAQQEGESCASPVVSWPRGLHSVVGRLCGPRSRAEGGGSPRPAVLRPVGRAWRPGRPALVSEPS
ncbi:MAG: hypothetical protein J3K34DRAFT_376390, partial [Monoraphidium minutum]